MLPATVLAHAQLVQSDPAPNARLHALPPAVTLIFTEPVSAAGVGIRVYSPSGKQVAGAAVVRAAVMSAPLSSSEQGTFVVSWQVFAADTHPSRGAYSFDVGAPSANPYSALLNSREIGTATPAGLALQALARWIHFAGFVLVFGEAGYRVLAGTGAPTRTLGLGFALLIAAEPLAVVAQLASLSFDGDTAIAVLGSSFGRLVALRLGAALLAWTLSATGRTWPLLPIGGAVALLDGLGAHAIPGWPGAGQLLVAVHVSAMGLWVGALVAYVQAQPPRFAPFAATTFAIAAGSGALLSFAHTPALTALVDTDYGRVLLAKVAVVGVAVVTVVARRRRLELAAAIAIVGAAALLAALPPSR